MTSDLHGSGPSNIEILRSARRTFPDGGRGEGTVVDFPRPAFDKRPASPMGSRARPARIITLALILAAVVFARVAADAAGRWRFSVNLTDSLPHWAFLIDRADRSPDVGQLVAFSPPPSRWFTAGAVFAKIVAGGPGDLVERRGNAFYVGGRLAGVAKARARDGSATRLGPEGIIPAGHYFVVTSHPDSLDSRYADIGWIPASRILGVARPVL